VLLGRLEAGEEPKVELDAFVRLAEKAGISLDWLATGSGVAIHIEPDSKYPTRPAAVGAAFLAGLPMRGLAEVMARNDFPEDPGVHRWLELITKPTGMTQKRTRRVQRG
jgi:hypothetical protein